LFKFKDTICDIRINFHAYFRNPIINRISILDKSPFDLTKFAYKQIQPKAPIAMQDSRVQMSEIAETTALVLYSLQS
jgi:hypothetical protein